MATTKNIIFDLGNVLLDLDFPNTERQFQLLLEDEFENVYNGLHASGHFKAHETNKISDDEFISGIKEASTKPLTDQQIIDAWNGMLVEIKAGRLEMLKRLGQNYKVYLLSNTNSVHIEWLNQHLQKSHGMTIQDFDALFVKPYYSYKINLRKPGTEIYEFVLSDGGMIPEETLFIDDNAANIEGARAVGIKAHHHEVGVEIADIIDNLL